MNEANGVNRRPETPEQIHETLYDGTDLPVTLLDGSTRMVKVRKISRKAFPAFASTFGDEDLEVAFYLGEPANGNGAPSIVEQLTEESFDAVMQEGHRLNFTRFGHWFGRQYQRLELMKASGAVTTAISLIEENPRLKALLASTKS